MNLLKIGDVYVCDVLIKQEDVNTFAAISGDHNPIHTDADYAKTTPFGRPIVHGIFSAAVFSKIFGTAFPGEGTIYMYQDLKFLAPVFVGDPYVAKCEILEVDPEKHRGVIKCILESLDGKICITGTAKLQNTQRF